MRKYFLHRYTPALIKSLYRKIISINYQYEICPLSKFIQEGPFRSYELLDMDLMLRIMISECSDKSVIFDIGSNVGRYSITLASYFPNASIHAFEPNPLAIQRLEKNIACNAFEERITTHNIGISNDNCQMIFYVADPIVNSSFSRQYILRKGKKVVNEIKVRVQSLDWLILNGRVPIPDYIKIDVEGHEIEVLEGAIKTLQIHSPVLLIETHIKEGKNTKRLIKPILKKANYHIISYGYPWMCVPID